MQPSDVASRRKRLTEASAFARDNSNEEECIISQYITFQLVIIIHCTVSVAAAARLLLCSLSYNRKLHYDKWLFQLIDIYGTKEWVLALFFPHAPSPRFLSSTLRLCARRHGHCDISLSYLVKCLLFSFSLSSTVVATRRSHTHGGGKRISLTDPTRPDLVQPVGPYFDQYYTTLSDSDANWKYTRVLKATDNK